MGAKIKKNYIRPGFRHVLELRRLYQEHGIVSIFARNNVWENKTVTLPLGKHP